MAKNIGSAVIDDILYKLAFSNFKLIGDPEIKSIRVKSVTYSSSDCPAEVIVF
ncbi:hypothetical protein [Clostridium sp. DJ247]|uniref:hypothetical protein n=1 Tax=Clostridium sp. DJ247 TaxID=2726188 RepID=UPI00162692A0|nr:hypothetical protein [Clostridium sp. DJ247]MBC2580579.1 hypothetical protein [Clostridium sp. DJ247]